MTKKGKSQVSRLRLIVAFLLSMVTNSLGVGFLFTVIALARSEESILSVYLIGASLGAALIASPFIAIGMIVVGVPSFFVAHNLGWTSSRPKLTVVGAVAGFVAAALIGLLIYPDSGFLFAGVFGVVVGTLSAQIWLWSAEIENGANLA